MRITGFVEVSNRLLPAFNMRSKNKGAQCQLSIGRKPGDGVLADNEVWLMISSKQDRNGAKYKVLFFLTFQMKLQIVTCFVDLRETLITVEFQIFVEFV